MNVFGLLKNSYFSLFIKREGKVVLGKSYSNLWLLVGVLTATFLAISFSNASLKYLKHKMDDPFINWVDIQNDFNTNESDFSRLEYELASEDNKEKFHYLDYQADYSFNFMFHAGDIEKEKYLRFRFFQNMQGNLVEAILDEDNVVRKCRVKDLSLVDENSIGVVITEEALAKMGCTGTPAYIYYHASAPGADYYGFDLDEDEKGSMPIPVLGIVKRLPGNVDVISSSYLYKQLSNDNTYPLNLDHPEYGESLNYFVPEEVDSEKFMAFVEGLLDPEYGEFEIDENITYYVPEMIPYKEGSFVCVKPVYEADYEYLRSLNEKVLDEYGRHEVYRVFEPLFSYYDIPEKTFLSVHFEDLDKIREFEEYVHKEFGIRIEMSQINAKENFNAVSTMANILSWAIIVFAIVCIILFIVNLLQSYFQKVKRNLGTFKAFGMGNYELISVYTLIMAATILVSIVVSLAVVWFSQGLMNLLNITRDGMFGYLSLWSGKTISAVSVIIFASVYTVYVVMKRLLRSTPGDLIYDR